MDNFFRNAIWLTLPPLLLIGAHGGHVFAQSQADKAKEKERAIQAIESGEAKTIRVIALRLKPG
jgi:hypothetical protein